MKHCVEITDKIYKLFTDAIKLESDFISLALKDGKFIIAIEGIRNMFSMTETEPTDHQDFSIRAEKRILKEIFKVGFMSLDVEEDKSSIRLRLYSSKSQEEPWINSVFGYSIAPGVLELYSLVASDKSKPIKVSGEIFTTRMKDLLEKTESGISVTDGYAYSMGSGLSVFLQLSKETTDGVSIDLKSYNLLTKYYSPLSEFTKNGNTFIMSTNGRYFTWRSMYDLQDSIEDKLSLMPLALYRLNILPETPFIFTKCRKQDVKIIALLDFTKQEIYLDASDVKITTKFKVEEISSKVSGKVSVRIDQEYLKFLVDSNGVYVSIFKKFLRIMNGNLIMDFGSDVYIE